MTVLNAGTQTIETERLILRRFTYLDATDMFNNWINDKEVQSNYGGVLGTVDENGIPQLKAMIKTAANGLQEFWFCSNTSSKRVAQIQKNPNASLYFYDEKTFEGLMLTGKAEVSFDDVKRKEFWNDGMKKYYPLGYTDPDFALIRFTASKGNYYHGLKNTDFDI